MSYWLMFGGMNYATDISFKIETKMHGNTKKDNTINPSGKNGFAHEW